MPPPQPSMSTFSIPASMPPQANAFGPAVISGQPPPPPPHTHSYHSINQLENKLIVQVRFSNLLQHIKNTKQELELLNLIVLDVGRELTRMEEAYGCLPEPRQQQGGPKTAQ
ncbi:hypothetical protein CMQ_3946 [Grosmannia clavigera kw1407]|uniref:Uncharacterized protein n=1 Tax=Grosmannia clavigera (strain kw1407 / UAMH 11150) TaxID=655863 RepID=F0X8N1_GROCL|nr:uncharacterized protein CMQ_3946 [Grosmannia clavigera kw1407]EFX05877.1 hypothetical protein CMQ_3946 [Grosmannia clavigera kw1407]